MVASGADGGVCDRAVMPMLVPPTATALSPTLSSPALQFSNTYGHPDIQRLEVGAGLGNMLTVDLRSGSKAGVALAVALMLDTLPPSGSEAMLVALHSSLVISDQMALRMAVQPDGAVRFAISIRSGGVWRSYSVASTASVSPGAWAVVVGNYVGLTRRMSVWIDSTDATTVSQATAAAAQVIL